MVEPREIEPGEREILEHSLKGGSNRVYRNYFAADPASEDGLVCLSLVEQGLMERAKGGYEAIDGLVYFYVTKAGAETVGLKLP